MERLRMLDVDGAIYLDWRIVLLLLLLDLFIGLLVVVRFWRWFLWGWKSR